MSRRPRRNHTAALSRRWHLPPSRAIGHWRSLPSSSTSTLIRLPRGRRSLRAELPMCSVLAAARRPASDRLKSLHAKIGELTLENDFLEGALTKAGLLSAKR